jgi:ABC-2 type transport system ATP-binding protein
MAEVMIEAKNLTKYYGDLLAIDEISFQVEKGEIVGFLGPNGSGKTTTMRILTGYMPPSSGDAEIAGQNVLSNSLEARRQIGYLPETVPLYTDMPVDDYLAYMGKLRGMRQPKLNKRIDQVIELVRLEQYQDTLIGKLSKGFRQRVGVAQAILHEPQVLILDEPTIGIDPIQVVETRDLIKDLGREHTLLLSSHILHEVSTVCQRVLIIHEGVLVAEDTPANLAKRLQATDRVEAEVRGPNKEVLEGFRGIQDVTDVSSTGAGDHRVYTIESSGGEKVTQEVARIAVQNGWGLLRLTPVSMTLEEIFLRLTTGDGEA